MMGSDFDLYWCRDGDRVEKNRGLVPGSVSGVVEVPVSWYLADFPYFEPLAMNGASFDGLQPARNPLETWTAEFDYLLDRGHGLFVLTLHPQVIGRGYRLRMLREFLERCLSRLPAASFVSCADYARAWRADNEAHTQDA